MPVQSRNPPDNTRSSENQHASQFHTSASLQNHLRSNTPSHFPHLTGQTAPMQPTQTSAAVTLGPIISPPITRQRQLEDQLSETIIEKMALEKHNFQLREQDLNLRGQILVHQKQSADLREQLFNLQEKSKHSERNACDASEAYDLELSRFKTKVSDKLQQFSVRRREADDRFATALNEAQKSRTETLQNSEHLVSSVLLELQGRKVGSNEGIQSPAEQPQEMPRQRQPISSRISSSGGNHGDPSTGSGPRAPTVSMVEDEPAVGTAASPQAPDKASKKRSAVVEASGAAASKERGVAKRIRTADQNSPHCEEEELGQSYPGVKSLLAKDDASYQEALEHLYHDGKQRAEDTSREQMKVTSNGEGMAMLFHPKNPAWKANASIQKSSATGGNKGDGSSASMGGPFERTTLDIAPRQTRLQRGRPKEQ